MYFNYDTEICTYVIIELLASLIEMSVDLRLFHNINESLVRKALIQNQNLISNIFK